MSEYVQVHTHDSCIQGLVAFRSQRSTLVQYSSTILVSFDSLDSLHIHTIQIIQEFFQHSLGQNPRTARLLSVVSCYFSTGALHLCRRLADCRAPCGQQSSTMQGREQRV